MLSRQKAKNHLQFTYLLPFLFFEKNYFPLDSDKDKYLDYLKFCTYYCYVLMKRKYVIQNKITHVVQNSRSIFVV